MKDAVAFVFVFVLTVLCLILTGTYVIRLHTENVNLKNTDRVELPDGQGYYVKNSALTQKFIDSVPEGETILVYGTVRISGKSFLRGKGVDKTFIRNMMSH